MIWDLETQSPRTRILEPGVVRNGGEFLSDGRLLMTSGSEKELKIWSVESDDVRVAGGTPALRGWAFVGGGAVDGRDLSAHGAQVRRQLASMMDGIEENEPEKRSYWLLRGEFATIVKLCGAVP